VLGRGLGRHPVRYGRWLTCLIHDAAGCAAARRDPWLFERQGHRYVERGLASGAKLDLLTGHFRTLARAWSAEARLALYAPGGWPLATVDLGEGGQLAVSLQAPVVHGCEGELQIEVAHIRVGGVAQAVAQMTVTVDATHASLLIGGLQGPKREAGAAAVRDATRAAHGWRPKNVALTVAYVLAEALGLMHLAGIAQAGHPRPGHIQADYDGFWIEAGGMARGAWFALPMPAPVRDLATVSSKHRAAYRRRLAVHGQLVALLQARLATAALTATGMVNASAGSPPLA